MAKSSARKQRERLVKQGKNDPTMMRGNWNGIKPITWCIPNKKKDAKSCDYNRVLKLA
jgi:hypothetical protein